MGSIQDNKVNALLNNGDKNLVVTDNTTNDVSTTAHGFCPKAPNDTAKFLRGDATWAVPILYARVTGSDATTTSASLVDIAGLSTALAASSIYEILITISAASSTTAGVAFGVNFSAAGATIEAASFHGSSLGAAYARINAFNTAGPATINVIGDGGILIRGVVVTGANAGNLTTQFLKVTSGTATAYINSVMKVTKVA